MISSPIMRPRGSLLQRQAMAFAAAFLVMFFLSWHFFHPSSMSVLGSSGETGTKGRYWSVSNKGGLEGLSTWKKPAGLKIVAMIFYGRPATVSILDCYLKRNLVKNGGMLDEVVWIVRTQSQSDIAWLHTLLETESAYTKWDIKFDDGDYRSAYDRVENGTMYIKIDDDMVFMEDTVIPSIAHTKYTHPEYFIVSANIMNQPSLSWVHYHLGAVKPYLPDLSPPAPPQSVAESLEVDWRASKLPAWKGNDDFLVDKDWKSAYPQHRWLPLKGQTNHTIDHTPIISTTFDAFSSGLWQWQVGAQEHYSFFENLEKNELFRYKFHTWDYNYTRMGIQLVALMGDDINLSKPMREGDDEYYFSEVMPKETRRHGIVDGRAVAAHYSFKPQKDGMASTDILDRYRSFAKEHICQAPLT